MLDKLLSLFEQADGNAREPVRVELAAAVLMVEVMAADRHWDDKERGVIQGLLQQQLGLSGDEAWALLEEAGAAQQASPDLFSFTHRLNDHYAEAEKYRLLVSLWRVAYADDELDRYEDHMIRRIAELLYVPHRFFIQAKHEAVSPGDGER